jgi:hypothetical protein
VNFAVQNDCEMPAAIEKLNYLLSVSRQLRPPRLGIRVLFESAQVSAFEAEIDLLVGTWTVSNDIVKSYGGLVEHQWLRHWLV